MCARTRMRVDVHVHTRTRSARVHEPRAHAICLTLSPQRPHQNNSGTIDKDEIIKEFGLKDGDTGSSEVQIALLTARVKHLTEHLRENRKDFHSRRGLIAMTARRRKLLDYLKRTEFNRYTAILEKLGLRK